MGGCLMMVGLRRVVDGGGQWDGFLMVWCV